MIKLINSIILLVLLLVALIFFGLNPAIKYGVETFSPSLLGTNVSLGRSQISPFSGEGEIGDLVIHNPEGYSEGAALSLKTVRVKVDLPSLFTNKIIVDEIMVDAPTINFEGNIAGNNLQTLANNASKGSTSTPSTPSSQPASSTSSEGGKKVLIRQLNIENGKIDVAIKGVAEKKISIEMANIVMSNIGGDSGAKPSEVISRVIAPVMASVNNSVRNQLGGLGKEIQAIGDDGKGALDNIKDKANDLKEGIKGLFGK